MWQKSENSEITRPLEFEQHSTGVILRRNYIFVESTEEKPDHWEYEELQLTYQQYEVYHYLSEQNEQQAADIDFLTMENEYLEDQNEKNRADIDYCLMIIED